MLNCQFLIAQFPILIRSALSNPMRMIEAILFEPVGCLAEFPVDEFNEAAVRLFGRRKSATRSGSRSYWHFHTVEFTFSGRHGVLFLGTVRCIPQSSM